MAVLRLSALLLSVVLVSPPACARESDAASAHRAWSHCLDHAFVQRAAVTGRDLAADAALRACRGEEGTYLAAISASPLFDADDIIQARPDLVARARAALLAGPQMASR